MQELQLPQGTLRYRDQGSGEPLVFLHGFGVNGRLWEEVVPRLSGDFRCLVPDLPLGAHAVPMNEDADLSAQGLAAIVAALLEKLGLERVTLVGNDSGGAIAQIVATKHPERVGRLVLTNCDLYDVFPPKLFAYLVLAAKIPGALTAVQQSLRFPPMRRTPLAYGALSKRRLDGELLAEWVKPGLADGRIRRDGRKFFQHSSPDDTVQAARDLQRFKAPALFAWAPEDRWFKIADAERLASEMPDARVERIADAKTFVSLDQPERLAAAIASFARETNPVAA
jgi:pimeloyl-ACP methyl ester carboxylesterase